MTQAFECVCTLYPLAAEGCPAHRARYVAQQHVRNTIVRRLATSALVTGVCEDAGCTPDWLAAELGHVIFSAPSEPRHPSEGLSHD